MMTINTHKIIPGAAKSSSGILNSRRAYCPFRMTRRSRSIICDVAMKSLDSQTSTISAAVEVNDLSSSPSTSSQAQVEDDAAAKIGARIRVKVPLKVYHVPRLPEVDLTGMEGEIKQYVGLWKGKTISANLPYKVEFITEVQGRDPVKFFAHLKEDEFEYI